MRILFLGTPDFAVKALDKLVGEGYDIVGAITQPDKRRNRGEISFCPDRKSVV